MNPPILFFSSFSPELPMGGCVSNIKRSCVFMIRCLVSCVSLVLCSLCSSVFHSPCSVLFFLFWKVSNISNRANEPERLRALRASARSVRRPVCLAASTRSRYYGFGALCMFSLFSVIDPTLEQSCNGLHYTHVRTYYHLRITSIPAFLQSICIRTWSSFLRSLHSSFSLRRRLVFTARASLPPSSPHLLWLLECVVSLILTRLHLPLLSFPVSFPLTPSPSYHRLPCPQTYYTSL
ncbi:hypothetical protein FA13DRAFT_65942 [Coprinellus micaceus]|uniref:Uncharacterized protein n=1 Tax=Coprinellus micaceus TaxID=71717 RepID=A0A4Y7TIT8_COPMI|nr:hypothetical protein FA13DRAFT_65942 [Coprinellus micaceus]